MAPVATSSDETQDAQLKTIANLKADLRLKGSINAISTEGTNEADEEYEFANLTVCLEFSFVCHPIISTQLKPRLSSFLAYVTLAYISGLYLEPTWGSRRYRASPLRRS